MPGLDLVGSVTPSLAGGVDILRICTNYKANTAASMHKRLNQPYISYNIIYDIYVGREVLIQTLMPQWIHTSCIHHYSMFFSNFTHFPKSQTAWTQLVMDMGHDWDSGNCQTGCHTHKQTQDNHGILGPTQNYCQCLIVPFVIQFHQCPSTVSWSVTKPNGTIFKSKASCRSTKKSKVEVTCSKVKHARRGDATPNLKCTLQDSRLI